jgi:uncharacterized protein (DUF2236 family)
MPVPDPKTLVRRPVGATMRRVFSTADHPRVAEDQGGDRGLFGPDSVTWRVHGDLSMLVGGIRALMVQTVHPLAIAGVAQHSRYRTDPLGRLRRTAAFVATTTYGSTAEADAAIAKVRSIHDRVRGVAADGRAYSANDPDLLAWVHHVEVQSFLLAYQRIGPGLGRDEADQYVSEMANLGARLGVPDPITKAATLHDWLRRHPEQHVTAEARAAVRFLAWAPLPLSVRGPYAVLLAAAISLIPIRQRYALGLFLPGPISGRLACEPAARALVGALGWSLGPSPALERARSRLGA